jgi:hypothetical protein
VLAKGKQRPKVSAMLVEPGADVSEAIRQVATALKLDGRLAKWLDAG